jgi:hypothetical protein
MAPSTKYELVVLKAAIEDQNDDVAKELLQRLEEVGDDDSVRNVWRAAARRGSPEIIRTLAEKFPVKFPDNDSIAVAMRRDCNANVVHALVEIGMDVNINFSALYKMRKGFECKSALREAAKRGNLEMVKFIVQKVKEKEPKEPLQDVEHSFIRACRHGRMDVVKYFLEEMDESPDIDCRDSKHGSTGLMFAAQQGNLKIVKYLVSKGADIFLISTRHNCDCLNFVSDRYKKCCASFADKVRTFLNETKNNILEEKKKKEEEEKKKKMLEVGITKTLTSTSGEKILIFIDKSLEFKAFSLTHEKKLTLH